jgi:hypothetical protein
VAGQDLPAVPVSDPSAAGGEEAAIVAGGDHLVSHTHQLGACGDAIRFDLAGGYTGGPRSHGELVDGVVVGGHHQH